MAGAVRQEGPLEVAVLGVGGNMDRVPGASRSRRAVGPRGAPRGLSGALAAAVDGAGGGRRRGAEVVHTAVACIRAAPSAVAGYDAPGLAGHRGLARGRCLPGAVASEAAESRA